jgi:eukaryotic-like serine/threonine-protein kinase
LVSDLPTGEPRVLGDRYELQDLIGRGGMAEVYRACDRVLDRSVAVKLMRALSSTDTERARFSDEARTLAGLSHPGLVTVLDAATTGDQPYLVMELIRGPSLAECCQGVALEPTRVAAIGAQLAAALGYAHSRGIVHRDLKPGNVLLAEDDRALLTDFGIARLMSEGARHTATGVTVGTAAYLAPEQVRGEDIGPATDVYSLGLVLLEALTGERAYAGSPTEAALARLTTPPPIPPAVPKRWHALLRDMTALDPTHRPTTEEVAASLRDLAAGLDPATATAALRTDTADSGHTQPLTSPVTAGAQDPPTGGTMQLRQARSTRSLPSAKPLISLVGRYWRWVAAGVVVLLAVIVASSLGDGAPSPGSDLPVSVPQRLEQPLQDLHDAVEGQP